MSLDPNQILLVVEAFTPNAIKDLLLVTKTKLRVYSVTKDSISLNQISSIHLPPEAFKNSRLFHFQDSAKPKVHILPSTQNQGFVLSIDPKTGKALSQSQKESQIKIFKHELLTEMKSQPLPHSKQEYFFVYQNTNPITQKPKFPYYFKQFRNRELRAWLDLRNWIDKRIKYGRRGLKIKLQANLNVRVIVFEYFLPELRLILA